MAFEDDLRSLLENRLQALDPTIDLSSNSPAQIKVIEPVLRRFAVDPLATDIPTFIRDRMVQEFPDLEADNGGMLEDLFTKPLQLLLEPFRRAVEDVRINQSVRNADIMSDDGADALGANWFEQRDDGETAGGTVRLYYAQPITSRITTDKRLYTSGGLSFFPVQNYFISAQQMIFNRQGNLYFLDIVVQAEAPGDDYNIRRGEIIGIDDVPGVVRVSNLADFVEGAPRETNEEYLGRFDQTLTERSLTTERGILARTPNLFASVRALSVIGAGEVGMNRDVLRGTGEGFLHLAGKGTIYGNWLWVSEVSYRDDGEDNSILPQPGDTIRFHEGSPGPSTSVEEAKILSILSAAGDTYLFLLDKTLHSTTTEGSFALLKPGFITISGVPGGMSDTITVPDDSVHLGGHTDVFVRPTEDNELLTTLQNVTDENPLVALLDLVVPTANTNLVSSASSDFVSSGVLPQDVLVIETGSGFAGTYRIMEVVDANSLRVDTIFSATTPSGTELRARIVRDIRVNLVEPRVPKLPFTPGPVSDLQTVVGSNEFRFLTVNLQSYGAKAGDVIRILAGPDAGEFIIQSFNSAPGGGVFVDRAATATGSNLSYEVYTKLNGIELPLVRVKSLEVLDSTGQGTGITVPYGDAVDIRPTCDLEGAGNTKTTYDKELIVFPDLSGHWPGGLADEAAVPGDGVDARYTQGIEQADGVVKVVTADVSNPITSFEVNVPPFLSSGRSDKLMALATKKDENWDGTGDNRTSDIARARIGDSLTIHDGPNQGKYIITDHRLLEMWSKSGEGRHEVALIQVDPPLRVDPLRTALNFLVDNGVEEITSGGETLAEELFGLIEDATRFDDSSAFYQAFLNVLRDTLNASGFSYTAESIKEFFDPLVRTSFTVGPPAKGNFRLYFLEPVSAELYFGADPTVFESAVDSDRRYRIDPNLPSAQIFPESLEWTSPFEWNRNLAINYGDGTSVYLTSGSAFAKRGIQKGDFIEYHPAINDLPSRGKMTSSWLCTTQTGSNVVQLILPPSDGDGEAGYGGADNYSEMVPGQLLFIDSGPDLGAYTILKVIEQDWSGTPTIKVQLDRPLTHTTENFPLAADLDFSSGLPASVATVGNAPSMNLNGEQLSVRHSTDGGGTWTTVAHTFTGADPFTPADIVAELEADAGFVASLIIAVDGNELVISHLTAGPRTRVEVLSSPAALNFAETLGAGIAGGAVVAATKRLYGSGLGVFGEDDYVTIYAAKSPTILSDGEDMAYLGTFKVTAVGDGSEDEVAWGSHANFIEISRDDNFPADAEVRWVRHTAPQVEVSNTSGGGKEISDQFVRFRLYESTSREREVSDFNWAAIGSDHPLLETSTSQLQVNESLVEVGERNYAHMAPYRVLRPGVLRVSSTSMAQSRDGALYYLDVPVVSYGPDESLNATSGEGFLLSGRREIGGYTLEVKDEIFVFSSKEEVDIILPNSVLPVGSTPDLENEFNLAGQNIQVTYTYAPLVDDIQAFFSSPLDRVTAANALVRHFIPAYVMLDAEYYGGKSESVVAKEIIKYINNIDPQTAEIRTDLIQDIIKRQSATKAKLPITVIALFHGFDRRVRGMRSETAIGADDLPFFKGQFNQAYFIAGPDTSKEAVRPAGEQVFLKRL